MMLDLQHCFVRAPQGRGWAEETAEHIYFYHSVSTLYRWLKAGDTMYTGIG